MTRMLYVRNIDFQLFFVPRWFSSLVEKGVVCATAVWDFTILKVDKKGMIKVSMTLYCLIFESKY